MPRVLFLHADSEDYLADSLLHGLRSVLGTDCVDVPRRDALYDDLPDEARAELYGNGFTLFGRLPADEAAGIQRDRWLDRVLSGEFDVVLVGDVHRNWRPWLDLEPHLDRLRAARTTLALCDGGDGEVVFPHGPTWWRHARPRPIPRAAGRVPVFKRELTRTSQLVARRRLSGVQPIGFSIPEDLVADGSDPQDQLLASHVVDPDVRALLGESEEVPDRSGYRFTREADYVADLRRSKFGITTKKAGWETLRHYELAAAGCVPCFKHLDRKPPTAAPFGLDASNCVPYSDASELLARLKAMSPDKHAELRAGTLAWAARNTTRARATWLLEQLAT